MILAKTIKGYGMGVSGEGQMITHQAKKMTEAALLAFRDRFELPLTDEQVRDAEYYKPPDDAPEMRYLRECRAQARRRAAGPPADGRAARGPGARDSSRASSRAPAIARSRPRWRSSGCSRRCCATSRSARHVVPIVPDESRTFGMEGLFRQVGIYSPVGQLYQPQDSEQLMFYKEDEHGQILEEGITEAGSMSSFIAAGTSYSTHGVQMIPFYIYYSMFGYQRVGDLIWAAGDTPHARASCSAGPPGARRSTARGCSTRTATATCCSQSSPTAAPTTRRSATRSR